ncbi:MAG: hypothetical protein ACLP59_21325 [Bryobacteraceae bacterium]
MDGRIAPRGRWVFYCSRWTGECASPRARLTVEYRLRSDFYGTGVTIGRHPMAYRRTEMQALGVTPSAHRACVPHPAGSHRGIGDRAQHPGTAKDRSDEGDRHAGHL